MCLNDFFPFIYHVNNYFCFIDFERNENCIGLTKVWRVLFKKKKKQYKN